ncbi:60 kDa neurofilament protein-like [Octopus sinensis]|uniref:60 kDa neurofilament protein-like n=1 Tax=Octopus sinensis TaxID=2607531 RepID=A0A6P7U007_9MOLL|nr:60 kDa neurofilament protein-like [Octopus sinensis]
MAMSGLRSMSVQVRESYKSKSYRPRTKARTCERRTVQSLNVPSMKVEYQYGTSLVGTSSEEFKSAREKEKSEMRDLNARLAHYIEVSRYNDALNKNLVEEMENLKATGRRGSDSMKNMYETELEQLRRLLDEGEREKAELRRQMEEKEHQVEDLQAEYVVIENVKESRTGGHNARLNRHNQDLQRELHNLQREYDKLLVEKDNEMNQLRTLLENTLTDLQSITDRNMSLQLEIMAYRKLLENEENRSFPPSLQNWHRRRLPLLIPQK